MAADGSDVLSFGPAERSRTWLLVPLALAFLLAGYLLGNAGTEPVDAAAQAPDPAEVLVAGVVRESFAIGDDLSFDVVLRNSGAEPLEVTVREVGRMEVAQPDGPLRVPASASRTLEIVLPTTCPFASSGSLGQLTAEVGSGADTRRVAVPVLEAADLTAYRAGLCARPTAESQASLQGVWVLDEAFARWNRGESTLLMWFRPDATFVVDDVGRLFTRDTAASGDYRVEDGRLRMVFRRGFVCAPDEDVVWEVHRRSPTVVSLRYVQGNCPHEPGGVWILSRVLSEVPDTLDP